ncbi:unnamed protein product [Staurois parvus]|uniref:Uncharacterized protein n=1 Tax=Staurois parvus TaxID=386267 RepID=A0ABN9D677_9NEOB|nr:unnamed protein product [Staurois parvus]
MQQTAGAGSTQALSINPLLYYQSSMFLVNSKIFTVFFRSQTQSPFINIC